MSTEQNKAVVALTTASPCSVNWASFLRPDTLTVQGMRSPRVVAC
jgi:hypothetical protein